MRKLRNTGGDLTYHHEKISDIVATNWKNKTKFNRPYSIDLTSATDRIPSLLTMTILGEL